MSVLDVSVTDDGNIEAIILNIHPAIPGDSIDEDNGPKTYQRSIFKPIVVENVPFFTLVYSEEIAPVE